MEIKVRHSKPEDFILISNYFTKKPNDYWLNMGVDPTKLPNEEFWLNKLNEEYIKPLQEKNLFYLIWEINGEAVGHSNVNNIVFGEEAEMHLHIWNSENTKKGVGMNLLKLTIPMYFKVLKIEKLFCQPYAYNPAPNKVIPRLGFDFVKKHKPIPVGWIHLDDDMNRYVLSKEKFNSMKDFFKI
ncbi:RimJ/RimL family protein N-acetyltransferase [Tenacibaculum adriaticum]|uniref:RimJ/RimL family protein N-acetyltransferase n=1 Tax=Tenacibaculum adriaticum TaxID=413713 RepID=A0A5S5DML2_9FLAO|nr:GNAT family protein [Tenacibaculum adriaticum]TYP96042.1 RimJ/RimL family protein N-acetyltransferase [Tenacibaculum adriaticum]